MIFVENGAAAQKLKQAVRGSACYVRPVRKSKTDHPVPGELSFVYICCLESGQEFVVARNHHEVQRAPESAFGVLAGAEDSVFVVPDFKEFLQSVGDTSAQVVDAGLAFWWEGEDPEFSLKPECVISAATNKLWHTPVFMLAEQLRQEAERVRSLDFARSVEFSYYMGFQRALAGLESSGLAVDEGRFHERFGDKDAQVKRGFVYPHYSMFTATGRPSNAFGRVNYAGLEKGEERDPFVSRFENGKLAELDYDAFHLRLLAEKTGYEFGEGSVHKHLGRRYFDKAELDAEEYVASKKQTFLWLYNGISEEALQFEFFQHVQRMVERKWKLYNDQGFVRTLGVGRKIRGINNPTPNKVLNYLIQSYETEVALTALRRAQKSLDRPVICLYTFDSFLLDVPKGAEAEVEDTARHALSFNGKYPMSLDWGKNYANLT
jgi:hypothetical protein